MVEKLFYLLMTYLVAGIPFGYIFVKIFKGIDVRTVGSGNIGATNVYRAGGAGVAALTGIFDILKGFLPTFYAIKLYGTDFGAITAVVAIIGHSFTVYMKFKGGKGVATTVGAFLGISPVGVLIGIATWLIVLFITRIVAVASLTAVTVGGIYIFATTSSVLLKVIIVLAVAIIFIRHKSNIKRLIRGEEPRIK